MKQSRQKHSATFKAKVALATNLIDDPADVGHSTARFQRTGNGKQLPVWVNEVVHHRLAAAAVSTDALLVLRPRLDFGGIGIDDRFNVREGIQKDDEPTTQMISCSSPTVVQL